MPFLDILGDEDHLGDMDFMVTGTKDGITATPMDIKVEAYLMKFWKKLWSRPRGRLYSWRDDKTLDDSCELNSHTRSSLDNSSGVHGAVIGTGGKDIRRFRNNRYTIILREDSSVS